MIIYTDEYWRNRKRDAENKKARKAKKQQKKKNKAKKKKRRNGSKRYADFQDWIVETRKKLLAGMTGAEKKARESLMVNKVEYKQQYPIHARQVYFADFYLPEHNVVIEAAGGLDRSGNRGIREKVGYGKPAETLRIQAERHTGIPKGTRSVNTVV